MRVYVCRRFAKTSLLRLHAHRYRLPKLKMATSIFLIIHAYTYVYSS